MSRRGSTPPRRAPLRCGAGMGDSPHRHLPGAQRMKRVVLLMGGRSAEREVSLVSGRECAAGLAEAGYKVTTVDVRDDLGVVLKALNPKPDLVFNALHGRYGEDGTIQGVL